MREFFRIVMNAVISILSAIFFGIPMAVFAAIDWMIETMTGHARMVEERLNYWKPYERKG